MANFTTCSFSLPIKITTATQIRLTLSNSAIGATTVTATAVAGTYYNYFDTTVSGAATSIVGHLLHQLGPLRRSFALHRGDLLPQEVGQLRRVGERALLGRQDLKGSNGGKHRSNYSGITVDGGKHGGKSMVARAWWQAW